MTILISAFLEPNERYAGFLSLLSVPSFSNSVQTSQGAFLFYIADRSTLRPHEAQSATATTSPNHSLPEWHKWDIAARAFRDNRHQRVAVTTSHQKPRLWESRLLSSLKHEPASSRAYSSSGKYPGDQDTHWVACPLSQLAVENLRLPCLVFFKTLWLAWVGQSWLVNKIRPQDLGIQTWSEYPSSSSRATANQPSQTSIAARAILGVA